MPLFPPASGGGGVATQDEGTPLGTTTSINFTGAGVVASGINPTVVAVAGGGGSVAQVAATITGIPYDTQFASAVVTDANISVGSKVLVSWGNVTDTDENGPDMDDVTFTSIPAAGSMTVRLSAAAANVRLGGVYNINYLIG